MSAALLVVDGSSSDDAHPSPKINLRVDHHPQPLDELRRLAHIAAAFRGFARGSTAPSGGRPRWSIARETDAGLKLPDDENLRFLRAGALVFCGRTDEAGEVTRQLVAGRASWGNDRPSFTAKGLLPVPAGVDVESFLRV